MRAVIAYLVFSLSLASVNADSPLPDPLVFEDGRLVTSPEDWLLRRAEIREKILATQYGQVPSAPETWEAEITSEKEVFGGKGIDRRVTLTFQEGSRSFSMRVGYLIPSQEGPFGVVIKNDAAIGHVAVAERLLERGIIVSEYLRTDLDPDAPGVAGPAQEAFPDHDWGTLAVWAWGGMRVIDHLLTWPEVDPNRIAVFGHSRGGKVALLTGALDERVTVTLPNGSGAGGAGLYRGQDGHAESLEAITDPNRFAYWFAPQFRDYAGREDHLPYDQHYLRALIAPRAVLSTDATGDRWANPSGTRQACVAAAPVFGLLSVATWRNACHFREGTHDETEEDWEAAMAFMDQCDDAVSANDVHDMTILGLRVYQPQQPLLLGKESSTYMHVMVPTQGVKQPKAIRAVTLSFPDPSTMSAISAVHVLGHSLTPSSEMRFETNHFLEEGQNRFPINVTLSPAARLDDRVEIRLESLEIDRDAHLPTLATLTGPARVGIALRQGGQDACHTYRIPGLATSTNGTLLAVYDNRYRGAGDLPNDIDVGLSRSIDGGQTWSPMQIIMDMGDDPQWHHDGIGDPAILVDTVTGRIWVAATWSHGNRSWHGSGPGMTPDETGQLMLTHSDDDGLTWSLPRNITSQVKDPKWRFVLAGPGKGITMRDGTLVFAAQYRSENAPPTEGKPFSTIITSRDRGETWSIGTGVKIDTTEAQVVELGDGTLMLNCRDNRNRARTDAHRGRTVAITRDLGKTWERHPTDRAALIEPTCMASLIRVDHPQLGALLAFSNPATDRGRYRMTLKLSRDEGMTWPEQWHTVYDSRLGAGYSCLTPVGDDHVGVLYEGNRELYFLRYAWEELLR